jgi:hypothetical protein
MKIKTIYKALLVTLLISLFGVLAVAQASSVTPTFVAGNPDCEDLGYDFGYKPYPEPPPSGTYPFPDGINSVEITSDGTYFDWAATLGIDAVIVKGGPNANVYIYDPEAEEDTVLNSPTNPNNDQPFAISHIEFCYDYEVDVSKTADTTFTRTWEWDIDKSVTPDTWDLFTGDSGTSEYTVEVTKTGFQDSDWAVSGTITIENNTPFDATIESVADVIASFGAVTVDCGVSFPYVLASEGTLECAYSTPLPDGSTRLNTATVTTVPLGIVGGGEATADVVFGEPTTVVNDTINVDDTNGASWLFSDSGSVSYERTFSCDSDAGSHGNVATIVETGQSDNASVTVNCYDLTVTKDADTSFDRTWEWSIEKVGDQTELTLSVGQQFLVNYDVTVDAVNIDSAFAVSGSITVTNNHPSMAAKLTGVADLVSPDIAATVDCPALVVPAGGSLDCSYSADLPDAASRTNTATATLQNYDYDKDGVGTADGTTDFSGDADVTFGNPTNEYDECIDVSDTNVGFLGTVCADATPVTFSYSLYVGLYPECGYYEVPNTASFITNDTSATGEDDWIVYIDVPCECGCTLTPGYWKTHSDYGPAPYDETWAILGGPDTLFFLSGQSYYEVLWTAPQGGNAYYILAHAYIAAELNFLNGASSTDEVDDAFAAAKALFETYSPDDVGAAKGKTGKELRAQFIDLATILDDYNNGLIGPGHCSE